MALPISVTYTFATATSAIPLSQLDANFTTVVNGINGIGNGTNALSNVQITGGTISNVSVTATGLANGTSNVSIASANGNVTTYAGGNLAFTVDTNNNASLVGTLAMGSSFMRNRIINGAMVIDQRNAGASVATSSGTSVYTVDRWQAIYSATSKFTVQQNAGSVTPPTGYKNYLGATSSSAYTVGTGDYFGILQFIEGYNIADFGWGAAGASSITLSFWVRSSVTGTYTVAVRNGATTRSYPATYVVNSANTWEQKTIIVAGDTTGTWASDNSAGIALWFCLGSGSTYTTTANAWAAGNYIQATGSNNFVATSGATFYITGVQLEVGSVATPFEREIYSNTLAKCQRYYQKWVSTNGSWLSIGSGIAQTSGSVNRWGFPLGVSLRTSPTINLVNCVGWDGSIGGAATVNTNYSSTNNIDIDFLSSGLGAASGRIAKLLINGATNGYIETSGTEL